MKALRVVAQIALLAAIYVACDRGARWVSSPVPGNVVGAILLAVLLLSGLVKLSWVEEGADVLLAHLGLFFVPAAVLSMRWYGTLRADLWAVLAIMISTTALVMVVVGWLAEPRGDS